MRWTRVITWAFVIILAALIVGITLTIGWRPFIGPKTRALTDRKFEPTPARLARGEYLTENLMNCFTCHSSRQWTTDGALVAGTKGAGDPDFPFQDLPGKVYPPNITPDKETGAGNWTDDEFARAIREGVGHDGRALFPFMPFENFASMSDEDLASVIVYLRSIPPIRREVPKTEIIFPVKYLIRTVPQPITAPVPEPDLSTPAKRGAYLVTQGGCRDCHTPQDARGQKLAHLDLAGGFPFPGPWPTVASANLTPAPSGIPYYDENLFVEVIRTGALKGTRKLSQIMPWWIYRGLTDDDLKAIFSYLQSVPAINHRVDNSQPPSLCPVCGLMHGRGNENTVEEKK